MALWVMNRVARQTESIPENAETPLTVPWNAAEGTHFYDAAIAVNRGRDTAVFSSTCSHLGCRINRAEGKELVCPCHGSRFDLKGNVAHGPADRGLRSLPFSLDRIKGFLNITLGSSRT